MLNNSLLHVGERAPACYGMNKSKDFYSFEAQAGRPAVVILGGSLPPSTTIGIITPLFARLSDFSTLSCDIKLMINGEANCAMEYEAIPIFGIEVIYCLSDFFERCSFDNQPKIFIIDRNQRILEQFEPKHGSDWISSALACLRAVPTEDPRDIILPAPVLCVPNIFSPEVCRTLIAHFESAPTSMGGMASVDRSGNAIHKVDFDKKRRQDCVLEPGEALREQVIQALTRRCLPEMKKAFQFEAKHIDRILIARYDESGGYFKRHRDNVAPSVAFRQFAISINLNTEQYEGGHLLFHEYNGHTYRPPTGAGIIFSASILHEAMPVTRGSRYVLLTFFHNSAAEAARLGGGVLAETKAA